MRYALPLLTALLLLSVSVPCLGYGAARAALPPHTTEQPGAPQVSSETSAYPHNAQMATGSKGSSLSHTYYAVLLIVLLGLVLFFMLKLKNKSCQIGRMNQQLFLLNNELEKLVKERTKDLSEALVKVSELEKLKSAFLSSISHEIRTPLNGILGFTQHLLESNAVEEEKKHYALLVSRLGSKLLRIVEDVLELAKVETNQLVVSYTDLNVNELLYDLYQQYSGNEELLSKNLNFRLVKSLPDPQAVFSVDAYRVRKIMSHLIENALKFTPEGSVEYGYYADSPTTLKFFVKDTGIGIPKKAQGQIFERFYKRASESRYDQYEGIGIGLAIAKGFALTMGGKIEVESIPGHGSTFYLNIPKRAPGQSPEQAQGAEAQAWKDKAILVVEDDLISYQYLEALLSRTKARLIHVKNAEDAIEVCSIYKNLNLVLLDIQLPFMNGLDAAKIIRQTNREIPIITQTASSIDSQGQESLAAGCNAFIAKPIDPDELFSLIDRHIL